MDLVWSFSIETKTTAYNIMGPGLLHFSIEDCCDESPTALSIVERPRKRKTTKQSLRLVQIWITVYIRHKSMTIHKLLNILKKKKKSTSTTQENAKA